MNKRKLSFRLNIVQVIHFIFLITLIFITNFLLIRSIIINHSKNELEEKCNTAIQNINNEFENVDIIADFIITSYKSGYLNRAYDANVEKLIKSSSKIITQINVTSNNSNVYFFNKDSSFKNDSRIISSKALINNWQVTTNKDITYSKSIDDQTVLTIIIHPSEIFSIIYSQLDKEKITATLFTEDGDLIFEALQPDSTFNKEIYKSIDKKTTEDAHVVKTTNGRYYLHFNFFEKTNMYLTVAEPIKIMTAEVLKYIFFWILISIVSIILFISMVFSSSYRLTKSITDIVQNIKTSKYLNIDTIAYKNEVTLIAKSFDLLNNRLKLYEQNIEKITTESQLLEKDMKIAQKLQKNLLPTLIPSISNRKEFDLFAISDSVYEIGGDLYDYFLIDENHLLIAVADVSGKGIPASLFMIYTHTLLRSIPTPEMSVSKIIENLNNKLIEENISDMFVTIFLGILNLSSGEFQYCNAAHCAPLIIDKEGSITEIIDIHGIPVGIYPNKKYLESKVLLKDEDQIFIFTDGLTDTIDENGLKYTIEVLKYNMMGTWFLNPKEVVEKIKRSVTNFRGNIDPEDDLTILDLKYKPRGK